MHVIHALHVPNPHFPLPVGLFRPAHFRPIAVVIPLDEVDPAVILQEIPELLVHRRLYIGPRKIEHELVTPKCRLTAIGVIGPVRVRAVKVAIRIDHLRLHPDAELHPQLVDLIHQRSQSARQLGGVYGPVAEPGSIVVARPKPAVVDDEQLDPQLGRPSRERELLLCAHVEAGRLP